MKIFITALLLHLSLFASVSIGNKAPDFILQSLNGKSTYSLQNFKGKVVLLNVWASWCGGCKHEMPALIHLQNSYSSGFQVLTINIDKDSKNGLEFLSDIENETGQKSRFVNMHDAEKSVLKSYNCMGMPSSYLIDKNGVIRDIIIGSIDQETIKKIKNKIDKMEQE